MRPAILDRVQSADNLPSLPSVALGVLRLSQRLDAEVEDVVRVVRIDPALTARILKVINSPLYGMPRKITSIKRAATLLGIRQLTMLALSFSVVEATRREGGAVGLDLATYWRHSLTNAVTGRLLAEAVAPDWREEFFVAGLLSDIGLLAGARAAPDLYVPVFERWAKRGSWSVADERECLQTDHSALSEHLLTRWGLPDLLCRAVGAHHGDGFESFTGSKARFARILQASTLLTDLFCGDVACSEAEACKERCRVLTGIDERRLDDLLDSVATRVQEIAVLLSVSVGRAVDFAQVRAQAQAHLTRMAQAGGGGCDVSPKMDHSAKANSQAA